MWNRRTIGMGIIGLTLGALFGASGVAYGWANALLIWIIGIVASCLLTVGIVWIFDKKEE